jgi:hypothetical protein
MAVVQHAVMMAVVVLCGVPAAMGGLMGTPGQFHSWVDQRMVLEGLSPTQEELGMESFLELVQAEDDDPTDMFASLGMSDGEEEDKRLLGKKACDPGYDCSQFQEPSVKSESLKKADYYKPETAAPEALFPVGKIPRAARCWQTCDYQVGYTYTSPGSASTNPTTKAGRAALRAAATSYLETESQTSQDNTNPDIVQADQMGSPFHCKTRCEFKEPMYCNPARRMLIGATGFSPQEAACCDKCDAACKGKTVLDRYRLCYLGCRAYCPFADQVEFAQYYETFN